MPRTLPPHMISAFAAMLLPIIALFATPVSAQTITFSAVGDVFFGRGGKQYGTEEPFRYVNQEFVHRDIVLGNLETPISAERRRILTAPCNLKKNTCQTDAQLKYRRLYYLTFQARVSAARLLKTGGFKVMSTANNHAEDQGVEGIVETLRHLKDAGVGKVGSGVTPEAAWQPYIFEKDGVKVGIIAATTILNFKPANKDAFVASGTQKELKATLPPRIAELKKQVDFVVVTLHYGAESVSYPSPRDRRLVEALSEAGADVFIGTHPHVLQGIQILNNTVVFWSLGNFLFDAPRPDWCESAIVHVDFVKTKNNRQMKNIRLVPITLSGDPKRLPHPANPEKTVKIIQDIRRFSKRFKNPAEQIQFLDTHIEIHMP